MKVVEKLSDQYQVALLNSKNAWRILGQESYAYEIAQDLEYDLKQRVVVVPIGNAGNITAVMRGFIKFFDAGIIDTLPKIIGVQSVHANPVCRYYREADPAKRHFNPVTVKSSVAQAAMIGNPVSMPRVIKLVEQYNQRAGNGHTLFIEVSEQEIMDWELRANRNGHIACTHGGECLAGLAQARQRGLVADHETAIVDSTAHALKFGGFQDMYFQDSFPEEFQVTPRPELINTPTLVKPSGLKRVPKPGQPLSGDALQEFIDQVALKIATILGLSAR